MSAVEASPTRVVSVRVGCWNLRSGWSLDRASFWPLRRRRVAGVLATLDADLYGFQEVFGFQRRWLLRHGLGGDRWRDRGDGRNRRRRGEGVPVVWRSDRVGLRKARTVWFGPSPTRPGSIGTGAGAPRVATVAEMRIEGVAFVIVNAHFDNLTAGARREAAEQIVALVAERPDLPHLVMGDLNATLDDQELSPFLEAGLVPALAADAGPTATAFETEEGRAIDHLLVTPHWKVLRAAVRRDAGRASDHYPLVAELELTAPERRSR